MIKQLLVAVAALALLGGLAGACGGGGLSNAGPSFTDAKAIAAALTASGVEIGASSGKVSSFSSCAGEDQLANPVGAPNGTTQVDCGATLDTSGVPVDGTERLTIYRFPDGADAANSMAVLDELHCFDGPVVTLVVGNGWAIYMHPESGGFSEYIAGKIGGTATTYTCRV